MSSGHAWSHVPPSCSGRPSSRLGDATARQLTWLDQPDLEVMRFQQFKERNPVNAGRFHGDRGDAALFQPVGDGEQIVGIGPEAAHVVRQNRLGGDAVAATLEAGTQTMCMSECTSMPAALGLRMVMIGTCSHGGRNAFRLGLSERVRWLMVSATL